MMRTRKWLSLLLLFSLLISMVPAPLLAARPAASLQQPTDSEGQESFLLIVTPPDVGVTGGASPVQAADRVMMAYAHRFAEVQAELARLHAQGTIAGYSAMPNSYAFQITGAAPTAQVALSGIGRQVAVGEVAAATVLQNLESGHANQLHAAVQQAITDAPLPVIPDAPAPPPPVHPASSGRSVRYTNAAGHNVYLDFQAPQVRVYLYWPEVWVYGVGNNVPVTATVKSNAGIVRGVGYGSGSGDIDLHDIYNNVVRVMPGDVVEVEMPDLITVPVVNLTALANPITDRVNGVAPPNITSTDPMTLPVLNVEVNGVLQLVTTDGAGAFQADEVGDVRPGEGGQLTYVNPAGHRVILLFSPPTVLARGNFVGYVAESYVSGEAPYGNQLVTVTLSRGGAPFVTNYVRADGDGGYDLDLVDIYGIEVAILPGDQIVAGAAGSESAVTVPTFAVQSNPETDQVTGTTNAVVVTDTLNAPQSLAVWPTTLYNWGYGKHVLLQSGDFTAANPFYNYADPSDWEATLDWGPGAEGHLRYFDAEGDGVYHRFAAPINKPVVYVRGSSSGSYVADHYASGRVNGSCDAGVVRLKDNAGAVKAQNTGVNACPGFSTYFNDVYGSPVPIVAGDQIEAIFGGQTTLVTVPSFAATSNADTDTVSGVTNATVTTTTFGANQSLAIYPVTFYGDRQNVLTESGGAFTANFVGTVDIQPGVEGHAVYIDNARNEIFSKFQAPYATPIIRLRGNNGYTAENYVSLGLPYSGSSQPLRLVVKNSTGAVRFDRTYQQGGGSWSQYLTDDFNQPININAGDVVEATYAGQTASVQAPGFSVNSDAINDKVSGTITGATVITTGFGMTQTLAVWPRGIYEWEYGKHVLAPGGSFVAENPFYSYADDDLWSTNLDWDPGAVGHLRYIDAKNNRVYARFAAMVEQTELTIYKGTARVAGLTPYANSWVTVTVRSADSVRGVANVMTDATGSFEARVYDDSGAPVLIETGNVVEAADASMTVPQLTMAVIAGTDTMTGTGPANSLLEVSVESVEDRTSLSALTDGAGAWTADFRGRADIHPGDVVEVQHKNLDGHRVFQEQVVGPQISALLNTNWTWGWALEPDASVLVVVKNGATVKGMATTRSEADGWYNAYPIDATGRPVILAPGDVVEVDFGGGRNHSLTLANLSISVDVDADIVNGTGPANQSVGVGVGISDEYGEDYDFVATAPTDGTGQWSINPGASGIDLRPGELADVTYTANGADFTWVYGTAPVHYVTIGDNLVEGSVGGGATVNVVLKRGGVAVANRQTTAAVENGYYAARLFDTFDRTVSIASGDLVEITASPTVTITVPVLQAAYDPTTRIVQGVGPANALLGVSYEGWWYSGDSQTVRTDSTGAFSVDLSAATDVDSILVRYREQGGNWVRLNVSIPSVSRAPYLWARWNDADNEYASNAVSGRASVANQVVTVTLKRSGATVASATAFTNSAGGFTALFRNNASEPISINAGDVIELNSAAVSAQAAATSYTVADVTVQTNQQSGTIFGTGPANKQLQVEGDCDTSTMLDPVGNYVATCALSPGATGYLFVADDNGARTYADWSLPFVTVRQLGNDVGGWVGLGVPVTVQLQRGGVIIATVTTTSQNYNGYFNASFLNATGQPVVIQPNDVVVVTAGGAETQSAATAQDVVTVPVTPMTAQVNPAADTVTGVGPANAMLTVWVSTIIGRQQRDVTTTADGSFTADYSGFTDLRPGDDVEVRYNNSDGNRVYLSFQAPLVRINLSSDIVDGYATPLAIATLVLKRGGATLATTAAQTDGGGFFSAFFTNNIGALVDIQVGDIVEVTASPTTALAAINLTATLDPATERVTGVGPANATILVTVYYCNAFGCAWLSQSVFANASGAYTADFSKEADLNENSYAFVTAQDAGGNQTTFSTQPVVNAAIQNVERQVRDAGASLLGSAAGVANEGNLTPPLQIVANGGRLIFAAQNGNLVVTAPDGSIFSGVGNYFVVSQAMVGVWSVQAQVNYWAGTGVQYAVAAGDIKYSLYLPLTTQQQTVLPD